MSNSYQVLVSNLVSRTPSIVPLRLEIQHAAASLAAMSPLHKVRSSKKVWRKPSVNRQVFLIAVRRVAHLRDVSLTVVSSLFRVDSFHRRGRMGDR